MHRLWPALLLGFLIACGGSPTEPSPQPVPMPAPIIQPDPALFDATFNSQLVHDAFDHPGALQPSRMLRANPSIYLQRTGLSDATVAALEQAARAVVPAMTDGRLSVARFESGSELRADANGWITVEIIDDTAKPCGATNVGQAAGHSWISIAARCQFDGLQVDPPLFAHELGHALGFWHVADVGHLMHQRATFAERRSVLPSDKERYHAGLAYQTNGAYAAR